MTNPELAAARVSRLTDAIHAQLLHLMPCQHASGACVESTCLACAAAHLAFWLVADYGVPA